MFETLKRMYEQGRLTVEQLDKAVQRGWITQEQFASILQTG